jgi:hypothetical protein
MLARFASVAACALALTVASPAAAQAASRAFVDGPGDVWVSTASGATQVPDRDQGDILRTTFTHGQHQVVVRTAFAQLNRDGRILVFTRLRTNTGDVLELSLTATPDRWRGRTLLSTPRGADVECRRPVSHSIDYASNVAVVRLPGTCLDNPRTVQAKFGVATWNTARRVFVDNPINHGPTENLPPYTAPVRVG